MRNTSSPRARLAPAVMGFWRNAKGSAAIEFAYLAPLLLLMLLATVEIGRAVNIDRHFTMATATAGDLVAREEFLGNTSTEAQTNLESMMKSIEHIMQPYDVSDLKMAIFSVRASTTRCQPTRASSGCTPTTARRRPAKCAPYTLPDGLDRQGRQHHRRGVELPLQAAVRRLRAGCHRQHDVDRQVAPQPAQRLRRLRQGRQLPVEVLIPR